MNLIFSFQFLAIIFKTLIGGVVGYITNDLAIQMLFKKKMGMGGVVEKTRDEFIENATDLIEEDIISQKVLKEKLETDDFYELLNPFLHQYLNQYLPEQIPDQLKTGDIPKSSQTFDSFLEHINKHSEPHIRTFLITCWNTLPADLIFKPQLLESVFKKLFPRLLNHPDTRVLLENFLNHYYQFINTKSPHSFISQKAYRSITDYLLLHLEKAIEFKSDSSSNDLQNIINTLIKCIQPEQNISMLIDYILGKKWIEIINQQQFNALFEELRTNFLSFLTSPAGKSTTLSFSRSLLKTINKSNNNLFDLVPDKLVHQFESFIYQRLAELIKAITLWIEDKRVDIEFMVNQSFSDQNVIGKIILNIGISLAETFNVVDFLKDYINGKIDIDQLAEQQSKAFINALKQNSIQDIFNKLENEHIISENQLAEIFQETIVSLATSLNPGLFHFFLEDVIEKIIPKSLFSIKMVALFQNHLPDFLINLITSKNKITDGGFRGLKYLILKFYKQPLNHLFPKAFPGLWNNFITKSLLKLTERFQETIWSYSLKIIQTKTNGKTISSVVSYTDKFLITFHQKLIQVLSGYKTSFLNLFLSDLWQKFGNLKVKTVFIQKIQSVIANNFHRFTKGSIKKISTRNLQSLKIRELSAVVENFMGRELKPITRFGAGLGLIAGFAMAISPGIEQLAGNLNINSTALIFGFAGIVFGLIGWGTNWFALKMIFRPHLPLYIWGYQIPLTPGVITKNKLRFAGKMGEFVQNHLLNESSIEKLFLDNQEIIEQTLNRVIQNNDNQLINDLIQKNKTFISNNLADYLTDLIASKAFKKIDFFEIITVLFKTFEPLITTLDTGKKLKQIVSEQQFDQLESYLNSLIVSEGFLKLTIDKIFPNLTQDKISEIFIPYFKSDLLPAVTKLFNHSTISKLNQQLDQILSKFSNNPASSLLTINSFKYVQSKLFKMILNLFANPKRRLIILDYLKAKISEEINPEKKINDIFEGKVTDFIIHKIDRVTHFFVNIALDYFQQNKQEIANSIYEAVLKKSDFLTRKAIEFSKEDLFKSIYDIFENKLPEFINTNELSLHEVVRQQFRIVGDTKIGTIGDIIDHEKITKFIDLCLSNRLLVKDSKKMIDAYTNHLFQYDIGYFLKLIHLNSFQNIISRFESEISIFLENIKRNLVTNQDELSQQAGSYVSSIVMPLIQTISFKGVRSQISITAYQQLLHSIISDVVKQMQQFQLPVKGVETIISIIQNTRIETVLDKDQVNQSLSEALNFIVTEPNLNNQLNENLSEISSSLLTDFNLILHQETRGELSKIALKGLMAGFKSNLLRILETIRFEKIVIDQISIMNPAKIEKMFYKFAGQYFPKLINYGFGFGVIFGVSMDLFYYFAILLLSL